MNGNRPLTQVTYQDHNGQEIETVAASYPYTVESKADEVTYTRWKANLFEDGAESWRLELTGVAPTYNITVNKSGLHGAKLDVVPNDAVRLGGEISLNIFPDDGQPFENAPEITVTGMKDVEIAPMWVSGTDANCYLAKYKNPTGDVTITVSGGTASAPYTASLSTDNLKGATVKLDKEAYIQPDDLVKVTIKPDKNKRFDAAPTMTVDGATVKYALQKFPDGSYIGTISEFTKDAVVTVEGEAVDAWTAKLDIAGLTGGKAYLNPDNGFGPDSESLLTVVFDGDKTVVTEPSVEVTGAKWKFVRKDGDNTYVYLVSGFTGNATIKVTGEANKSDSAKHDIKVDGSGTHQVGSGSALTFTCSLPLEDLLRVLVDGKVVDPKNYDAKSGSTIITLKPAYLDTLSSGKHTIMLAYTGDREASLDFTVTKSIGGGDADDAKLAETGDPLDAAPLAGALGMSVVALAGAAALRRKHSA
ncbi:hypothetical protein [Raoultibacter phocaeensis]|uniref:hypothetical protein n=1 Tax=Raoultibacter phocaeensis TaxID=2479841 RepID=UPI00111973EC|nr:hypothetical protein [Raoultibacter phocaeensis]